MRLFTASGDALRPTYRHSHCGLDPYGADPAGVRATVSNAASNCRRVLSTGAVAPSSEDEPILPPDTLNPLLPPPKIPATSRPAVRRIIHTEAIATHDRTTYSDSISRSRILAAARNDEQTALEERPNPTGTLWLKWTAACLLLVLLILLWLKLR